MANIKGEYHLINTDNQVILRIPVKGRSLSIYLDKKDTGTTAEIYQNVLVKDDKSNSPDWQNTEDEPHDDFIKALEWLGDALNEQHA